GGGGGGGGGGVVEVPVARGERPRAQVEVDRLGSAAVAPVDGQRVVVLCARVGERAGDVRGVVLVHRADIDVVDRRRDVVDRYVRRLRVGALVLNGPGHVVLRGRITCRPVVRVDVRRADRLRRARRDGRRRAVAPVDNDGRVAAGLVVERAVERDGAALVDRRIAQRL